MPPASVFERTASEEFSKQRRRRKLSVRQRADVLEELEQPVCLRIFGNIFGNLLKYGFCLRLYNRKLEKHCRVEHHVGILLVGEYPLVLARPYARPAPYRIHGAASPVFVVAYYPSKQAVVGGGYVVVVV